MKAAPFAYTRATDLAEVCTLLRQHGDDARVLAGGQTLLATLAMRLSEPAVLIDVTGVAEMQGIDLVDGRLRIGALVRHVEIERSDVVARHLPLLALAAPHVAHAAIRNRGTFGGSIAFADPAAEWPACAVAADGELILGDGRSERRVAARDFFLDLYQTDLRRGEVITAVEFPLPGPARRFAFAELARRHGDYATVGLAMAADLAEGRIADPRIVFFGVGNTPVRARAAEAVLAGTAGADADARKAAATLADDLAPSGDLYTSAESKLHLAGVLLRRGLVSLTSQGEQR
jgi:aerobic carbon-monoxide dehydrogenase medium subunit